MQTKKEKSKTWTIFLSSGPQKPVKKFNLSKKLFYSSFVFVFALIMVVGSLTYIILDLNNKQSQLYGQIEEQEAELVQVQSANTALYEEALEVQQTIEEFKDFEARLSELELDLPEDLQDTDGSGGLELPSNESYLEHTEEVSNNLSEMKKQLPEMVDNFEQTVSALAEYEEQLKFIPTYFPAEEGRISSEFGNRSDPFTGQSRFHSGADIAAPLETPIYAAAEGEVILAGRNGGYGETVVIDHGETYETLYAHLNSIDVSVGDRVEKGEEIGGMGTTGRSTGVHLHYEIIRNGEHVNPYLYMTFHDRDEEE
ncbi:M23 family metallopeptidase [Virgibacillus sp. YIM 98842]|uniref:M23 family metallopeptidase n=1 Tax=Virgibacillus sp. YIM 98842 TaxID=2663533 RepID=UPI0013DBD726|nr:M23 family metallopeptidase [Virgibacillus sp. YIM 98842]